MNGSPRMWLLINGVLLLGQAFVLVNEGGGLALLSGFACVALGGATVIQLTRILEGKAP